MGQPFPEVVSVTPAPGAPNVPTRLYLELGFSQPMNPASVEASTLRITDVDGGDESADYNFSIQIGAATDPADPNRLATLNWNNEKTILKLTSSHQLAPANDYRLDIVDNKAHSATGIGGPVPLILGPGTIQVSGSGGPFTMPSDRFDAVGGPINLGKKKITKKKTKKVEKAKEIK